MLNVRHLERYLKDITQKSLKVDLTVIREGLQESKPCAQCIKFMNTLNLNIRNITYSNNDSFITEKLKDIENDHQTLYYRCVDHEHVSKKPVNKTPKTRCKCPVRYRHKCKHNHAFAGNHSS